MHLHLVWFKRDLRTIDHRPLHDAMLAVRRSHEGGQRAAVLGLYLFEPALLASHDVGQQHIGFAVECLQELSACLERLEVPLQMMHSDALETFTGLIHTFQQAGHTLTLHSHEETGHGLSYQRDLAVAALLKAHQVDWIEYPSNGVIRRLANRDHWSALWHERMVPAPLPEPDPVTGNLQQLKLAVAPTLHQRPCEILMPAANTITAPWQDLPLFLARCVPAAPPDKAKRQRGGRSRALRLLDSFLNERGLSYRYEMSSPLTATRACSRLSPHITFGCVSIRELVHHVWQRRQQWHQVPTDRRPAGALASLKSFESRLHWHCHFIQKLESEPDLEFRSVNPLLDDVRNKGPLTDEEQRRLHAWATGYTGFPMIDACMRMLTATGWINFRMRALLVSFASYQLWLDWRHTAPVLAREFLDYEPGIHYPQFQMQSGVTGINTIRIYNPVKQAKDQDPDGVFIRRWVPELAEMPVQFLAAPWECPRDIQMASHCLIGTDYPAPVVDPVASAATARDLIWTHRRSDQAKEHAKRVYEKHGSRNPNREGTAKRRGNAALTKIRLAAEQDTRQLGLFDDNPS